MFTFELVHLHTKYEIYEVAVQILNLINRNEAKPCVHGRCIITDKFISLGVLGVQCCNVAGRNYELITENEIQLFTCFTWIVFYYIINQMSIRYSDYLVAERLEHPPRT